MGVARNVPICRALRPVGATPAGPPAQPAGRGLPVSCRRLCGRCGRPARPGRVGPRSHRLKAEGHYGGQVTLARLEEGPPGMRDERERTCAMVAIPTDTTQLPASRCAQLAKNSTDRQPLNYALMR